MSEGTSGPPKCTHCGEEIVLKVPPVQVCVFDDHYGYKYLPFCRFFHVVDWAEEHCQCTRCKRIVDGNEMEDDDICKACASGKMIEIVIGEKGIVSVAQALLPPGSCQACGYVLEESMTSCPECETPVGDTLPGEE